MKHLPATARDLVKALDTEFPHRCLRPTESPADAHRYAGKRDVVDYLLRLLASADNPDKLLE